MKHPLWYVGFRPFFILSILSGAALPMLWAAMYLGYAPAPTSGIPPVTWHAHEMLFGFGWAVLGGFLLTASKNWLKIRGLHGTPLFIAAALWVLERWMLYSLPGFWSLPLALRFLLANLSVLYVGGYVVGTLVRYRHQDSFQDNFYFVIALPALLLGKLLILSPEHFVAGYSLAIGVFRLAFAVMFERTMTQFMKNTMNTALLRNRILDYTIKTLVLLAIFQAFLPDLVAAALMLAAGLLLLARLTRWHPLVGLRRFEIGIMYVGYAGLTTHFLLEAVRLLGLSAWVGAIPVHTFTFFCMGLIIPAMMVRISQGHTGRKLVFTASDRLAIMTMGAGGVLRVIAPQLWPAKYALWSGLAATAWSVCFVLIGWRLIPFLWQPRVDGRIH